MVIKEYEYKSKRRSGPAQGFGSINKNQGSVCSSTGGTATEKNPKTGQKFHGQEKKFECSQQISHHCMLHSSRLLFNTQQLWTQGVQLKLYLNNSCCTSPVTSHHILSHLNQSNLIYLGPIHYKSYLKAPLSIITGIQQSTTSRPRTDPVGVKI